ncbi:metal-dependent transcriptional regulator [Cellulomonas fimi]|uniref:Manganese transport regulator n=1 Tax=Cellulomonas fimi (strain ATCC 484 / DSM 20113 / JCM 1341 / CCUG 24087 / LMG 16345 / NBRC 15513 / NCIMB 8980 / NCTC 7547 / NRS-133) TaxID=590998 RepID=F4H3F8_CELFA|nr:metal-dependent transcriptional regulator [Cellulomonas fimi]AEE46503.1 iron (metal) dependent repressor, DtxR family [Cellulomonas fimi ATCC 484]NNH08872.1 metal-dependent transcriptional regulator [Cellulomonas fimi]VEH33252.1 Iron-dependent repressor IdeR [Cellulomonas fimi]
MSTQPTPPLTAVTQDYLKVVWSAQEWSTQPVTTKLLAARLGVGASTVSETVRRLADAGLVTHQPYGAVELTAEGRRHALAMVRRHRLVETFLVEVLGYGWDEVHDEAEVLEHAVSDLFVERIDAQLGRPRRDPHGDPIPGPDGSFDPPPAHELWEAATGPWSVARISDADPELLRYVESVGLVLDAHVDVVERRAVAGVVSVRVGEGPGAATVDLGEVAARAIWLVPRG